MLVLSIGVHVITHPCVRFLLFHIVCYLNVNYNVNNNHAIILIKKNYNSSLKCIYPYYSA